MPLASTTSMTSMIPIHKLFPTYTGRVRFFLHSSENIKKDPLKHRDSRKRS